MRKLIAILLVIVLCLSFAACGKKEDSEEVKLAKQLDSTLASMTGDVEITDLYNIQSLREQYDTLPEDAQSYVEHYSVLTDDSVNSYSFTTLPHNRLVYKCIIDRLS